VIYLFAKYILNSVFAQKFITIYSDISNM